jgi:hypothetical protein
MSLVITTYVPEGIVMASDSRQSITIGGKTPDGKDLPQIDTVNSDNVYKTFLLSKNKKDGSVAFEVGVNSFGQDLLGGIPMASHIKRFSEEKLTEEDDITTIPQKLIDFFKESFGEVDTGFQIAGYKKEEKISVPYVFYCHIKNSEKSQKNINPDSSIAFGATWSGQLDVITGMLSPSLLPSVDGKSVAMPKAAIIWDAMALQDAIDFSIFAIRTTIDTIRFQARPKNVGGAIDVLVIKPDEVKWIMRKELKAN